MAGRGRVYYGNGPCTGPNPIQSGPPREHHSPSIADFVRFTRRGQIGIPYVGRFTHHLPQVPTLTCPSLVRHAPTAYARVGR
jgi:hypothetical protein